MSRAAALVVLAALVGCAAQGGAARPEAGRRAPAPAVAPGSPAGIGGAHLGAADLAFGGPAVSVLLPFGRVPWSSLSSPGPRQIADRSRGEISEKGGSGVRAACDPPGCDPSHGGWVPCCTSPIPPVVLAAPGPHQPTLPAAWPEQLTEGQMRLVLDAAGWPRGEWERALAVAWCESRWRPTAVGDGGASLGLWQLWRGWFGWAGESEALWADPVVNARVALAVWRQHGWEEWACRP